ncbi:MAG: hypothetical protein GF335_03110 [Candidatus Moranbacteria bacterium]|nr:hypothetical protein [Candidatus Moranbacteria bacterium]
MKRNKKKLGLALGSGGLRGFFHLGALKELEKNNIIPDFIAGSSMGAFVAAFYALFQDTDKIQKIMTKNKNATLRSLIEPSFRSGGLIKGDLFLKRLKYWTKDLNFKHTKIPLKITSTDLVTGREFIFSKGSIALALRASMAFPTLFKPLIKGNQILADGGLTNPVPDDIVRKMGADVVLGVSLDSYKKNNDFSIKDLKISKISRRSIEILTHALSHFSTVNSDIVIKKKIPVGAVDFNTLKSYFSRDDKWLKIIKMGEKETQKHIARLKKILSG